MTSMETPRLLSEYVAARAQSDGRISADTDADVAVRIAASSSRGLQLRRNTSHLYSMRMYAQPVPAATSGERTRLACWRTRPAIANFFCVDSRRRCRRIMLKIVSARHRNQHARRVRSPEVACDALFRSCGRRRQLGYRTRDWKIPRPQFFDVWQFLEI